MLGLNCASAGKGDDVGEPPVPFAGVLRRLRTEAGLTQEELAGVAGLRPRAISDLERSAVATMVYDPGLVTQVIVKAVLGPR